MIIAREGWGVKLTDEEAGIEIHGIGTMLREGRVELYFILRESDEVNLHRGDLEIYIDLDRLSALPAMIRTFREEVRHMVGSEHGTT
jgi:hypothetical protein